MAKHYSKSRHEIYWTSGEALCFLEEEYFELSDFLAIKRLDGHDERDQWYMLVHRKMAELLDVLAMDPTDTLDEEIHPLF